MISVCIVNVLKNRNNSSKFFICNSFKRVAIRNLIISKGNAFVGCLSWYLILHKFHIMFINIACTYIAKFICTAHSFLKKLVQHDACV